MSSSYLHNTVGVGVIVNCTTFTGSPDKNELIRALFHVSSKLEYQTNEGEIFARLKDN